MSKENHNDRQVFCDNPTDMSDRVDKDVVVVDDDDWIEEEHGAVWQHGEFQQQQQQQQHHHHHHQHQQLVEQRPHSTSPLKKWRAVQAEEGASTSEEEAVLSPASAPPAPSSTDFHHRRPQRQQQQQQPRRRVSAIVTSSSSSAAMTFHRSVAAARRQRDDDDDDEKNPRRTASFPLPQLHHKSSPAADRFSPSWVAAPTSAFVRPSFRADSQNTQSLMRPFNDKDSSSKAAAAVSSWNEVSPGPSIPLVKSVSAPTGAQIRRKQLHHARIRRTDSAIDINTLDDSPLSAGSHDWNSSPVPFRNWMMRPPSRFRASAAAAAAANPRSVTPEISNKIQARVAPPRAHVDVPDVYGSPTTGDEFGLRRPSRRRRSMEDYYYEDEDNVSTISQTSSTPSTLASFTDQVFTTTTTTSAAAWKSSPTSANHIFRTVRTSFRRSLGGATSPTTGVGSNLVENDNDPHNSLHDPYYEEEEEDDLMLRPCPSGTPTAATALESEGRKSASSPVHDAARSSVEEYAAAAGDSAGFTSRTRDGHVVDASSPSPPPLSSCGWCWLAMDWKSILFLSAFSVLGSTVRAFSARLFGGDCESPDPPRDFYRRFVVCLTASGQTEQWGSALFLDLPANVLGSFLMGFLSSSRWPSSLLHMAFRTGFCGSLTTFSSWNAQMVQVMNGTGTRRGSQVWTGLFGYLVGLQMALASFHGGQDVSTWLHHWHETSSSSGGSTNNAAASQREKHPQRRRRPFWKKEGAENTLNDADKKKKKKNGGAPGDANRTMDTDTLELTMTALEDDDDEEEEDHFVEEEEDAGDEEMGRGEKMCQKPRRGRRRRRRKSPKTVPVTCCGRNGPATLNTMEWSLVFGVVFLLLCFIAGDMVAQVSFYRQMWMSSLWTPPGALLRWQLGKRWNNRGWIPWGTLLANLVACWIAAGVSGLLLVVEEKGGGYGQWLAAVRLGFAGSLSTVSTFVQEVAALRQVHPHSAKAYAYAVGSLVLCSTTSWALYSVLVAKSE